MCVETNIADPTEKIREIDLILDRIRLALQEGILTIDSLKIYTDNNPVMTEKAVEYLQEVQIISINPENGEISLNKKSPYGSFAQAFRCHMPIWEESLEAFRVNDPERFRKVKNILRMMPAEDVVGRKMAVLFMKIFEGEDGIDKKIGNIKEEVVRYCEISICDIRPYQEDLMDEMLLFIFLSRREPTEAVPGGFVSEADAIEFFKRIGYEEGDVKCVLEYLCKMKILRRDPKSDEKKYAITDASKIMPGNPKSEKRKTILDKKIKEVLSPNKQ